MTIMWLDLQTGAVTAWEMAGIAGPLLDVRMPGTSSKRFTQE